MKISINDSQQSFPIRKVESVIITKEDVDPELIGTACFQVASLGSTQVFKLPSQKEEIRQTFQSTNSPKLVVVAGGDGTVSFIANLVRKVEFEGDVLVLPFGTGNDLARTLGLGANETTHALRAFQNNQKQAIDLAEMDSKYVFSNMLTGGVGATVTTETDSELKEQIGKLAYLLQGLSTMREKQKPVFMQFEGSDCHWEGAVTGFCIGNGQYSGGGFHACPTASLTDGKLNLTIFPENVELIEKLKGLIELNALHKDEVWPTFESDFFKVSANEKIQINLDGEPFQRTSFEVGISPQRLNVYCES